MKFGLATKIDKRNKITSKKFDDKRYIGEL